MMRLLEWLKSKFAFDNLGDDYVAGYMDKPRPVVTDADFRMYKHKVFMYRFGKEIAARSVSGQALLSERVIQTIRDATANRPLKIRAQGLSRSDVGHVCGWIERTKMCYAISREVPPSEDGWLRHEILVIGAENNDKNEEAGSKIE